MRFFRLVISRSFCKTTSPVAQRSPAIPANGCNPEWYFRGCTFSYPDRILYSSNHRLRMFSLSKKTKGSFIEINEHTVLLARTSSPDTPMVVEDLKHLPAGDNEALQGAIKELMEKRSASGYMHSCCAVYPRSEE